MDFTLDSWYQDQKRLEELANEPYKRRDAEMAQEDRDAKYKALQQPGNPDQIYHPRTQEEYNAIPLGGTYVDPGDGQIRKKGVNDLPPKGTLI